MVEDLDLLEASMIYGLVLLHLLLSHLFLLQTHLHLHLQALISATVAIIVIVIAEVIFIVVIVISILMITIIVVHLLMLLALRFREVNHINKLVMVSLLHETSITGKL